MATFKRTIVHIIAITSLISSTTALKAQDTLLTLDRCYELARNNYPLIKTAELINKTGDFNVSNIKSGYFPSLTIFGQYTTQSDVTSLPVSIPNMSIPQIDKNQYKAYAEVSQVIYDGGMIRNQKSISEAQTNIEEQSLEVELYKVKERINQIYFGILLLDGQIKQVEILKKDILAGLQKSKSAYENGTILKSNVDALQAELLKTDQKLIELKSGRQAYLEMLGIFTDQKLLSATRLAVPDRLNIEGNIFRPELNLFTARTNLLSSQSKVLSSKNLPKLNLFVQGGYGSPALNMLDPDADTYYMAGIRLAWPLTGFYNLHRERLINTLASKNIESQKETFLFNTNLQMTQQRTELEKLTQLIQSDDEIVSLREEISKSSLLQLENGVITSADYLREVTAADNARQTKVLHELQYLMAQYNYRIITGNK